MSKIGLIIKSEYLRRVAKKSFILLTFLVPFLFAATLFIPLWLSDIENGEVENVAVVDQVGKYKDALIDTSDFRFTFVEVQDVSVENMSSFVAYDIVVLIENDLLNVPAITMLSEKQVPIDLKRYVENSLEKYVEEEKIASYNIPNLKTIIKESQTKIAITTIKLNEDGSPNVSSTEVASGVGMLFMFLIYFFVFVYGTMVMNSVVQEKTNRIVEVIICSVKPFELMLGKIISIALVGLTQFLLWVFFIAVLIFAGSNFIEVSAIQPTLSSVDENAMTQVLQGLMSVNFVEIISFFVLYFIGGYLLYASLFASIGAAVDNETDTQQFVLPITIPILFAMYAGIYSIENPDGPLAFWCSLVPFTSPIVMMVRLPFGVALWEKLLSLAILVATFLLTTWMAAKIYRTGILMYGKKITWRELLKWIKYKN
ncbi:MAG: ABC transporter permease [Paludibacteraceae bacterium]|nr:ABC transporter permease [Paludibacteraceae bacterium]